MDINITLSEHDIKEILARHFENSQNITISEVNIRVQDNNYNTLEKNSYVLRAELKSGENY